MRILKWLSSLLGNGNSQHESQHEPQHEPATEPAIRSDPFGFTLGELALQSGDYGWSEPKPHKLVLLTNPQDCKEKLTVFSLASSWRGTGHAEWEFLLAKMFLLAVSKAVYIDNSAEADITYLFDRDFFASKNRTFTSEQVYSHIISFFDIIEDTDEVMRLKIHLR